MCKKLGYALWLKIACPAWIGWRKYHTVRQFVILNFCKISRKKVRIEYVMYDQESGRCNTCCE
jgi:hypothetical protein